MEIRYDKLNKKLDGLQLKQQQCAPTLKKTKNKSDYSSSPEHKI